MKPLVLSTQFQFTYDQLHRDLPQSVLLSGQAGVGLLTIAKYLAKDFTTFVVVPVKLTKTSTTRQISIHMIRELYDDVRTSSRRVVIIDDADAMTPAAQNALLKLLEEPNATTRFILTSHHPELLLPTIRSRVATFHVPLVDHSYKNEALLQQFDQAKQRQLLFLASGKPAELYRLSIDEEYFTRVAEETSFAKQLIGASGYERTASIAKMKLDRDTTLRVIERSIDLLSRSPAENTLSLIESLTEAYTIIQRGGNAKLQLLRAML